MEQFVDVEREVGVRHEEVERMRAELEMQAERDKSQLLEQQLDLREQKLRLTQEMQATKQTVRDHRDEQIRAASRLKQLQSKLVQGGVNLMEQEEEQRLAASAMEEEIAERKRQEQELLSEQELEEEARLGMEEHYNSLQEEADAKTRKLKKLWGKYKALTLPLTLTLTPTLTLTLALTRTRTPTRTPTLTLTR